MLEYNMLEYKKITKNKKTLVIDTYDDDKVLGQVIDNVLYSINGQTALGIDPTLNFDPEEIIIKEGAKRIAAEAFADSGVVKVILPESLETIGAKAFNNSCLEEINLENILSFGPDCFSDTRLNEVIINENAVFKSKGTCSGVFEGCEDLKKITINCSKIPEKFCASCYRLEEVILSDKIKEIPEFAFTNCRNLKKFTFHEGLEIIHDDAFSDSAIEEAIFPSTLKVIGTDAFCNCTNLTKAEFAPSSTNLALHACCFNTTNLKEIIIPENVKFLDDGVVLNCPNLETLIVNAKVCKLPNDFACGCCSLKTVRLSPSIESLGENCFAGTDIKKVSSEFQNINYFGDHCFYDCPNLQFVHIPKNTTVDLSAFRKCINLKLVLLESTDVIDYAFAECSNELVVITPPELDIELKDSFNFGDPYLFPATFGKYTKFEQINVTNINELLDYMPFKEIAKVTNCSMNKSDEGIVK